MYSDPRWGSFGLELDFYELFGIARCGLELPVSDRGDRALSEEWVSALHIHFLNRSVGRNLHLKLYDSVDVHGAGKSRIDSRSLRQDFPGLLGGLLALENG